MVKTIEELKELIKWAKEQKISAVKIGDIEFHVSTQALSEVIFEQAKASESSPTEGLSELEQKQKIEDDEDLFWSTRT